jgi:hypothetical protein
MRKLLLLIAGLAGAAALVMPRSSEAWVRAGLGIGYAGPYPYPPGLYAPYYPYYPPPIIYPPVYYPPSPVYYWGSYDPNVAVRWNRYFDPPPPIIRGYTLPR